MSMADITGPAWDLSAEYTSTRDERVAADLAALAEQMDEIERLNATIIPVLPGAEDLRVDACTDAIAAAQAVHRASVEAMRLLGNVATYANCVLSVDSGDREALDLQGRLQAYQKRFGELSDPAAQFVDLVPDAVIAAYLAPEDIAAAAFNVHHSRKLKSQLLGLEEEGLAGALAQDGIHAWGRLYTQLSGTLSCAVLVGNETQTMGLAQASTLMSKEDAVLRKNAWQGINAAWSEHGETCAAAVNAIAGWRLEMGRRRSHTTPVHFLDAPLHMSRYGRDTLDALMAATEEARPIARRAAKAMAAAGDTSALGPWDLRAPAPAGVGAGGGTPFDSAVELIADAYGEVDASMADFVRMMAERRWVEGTVAPNKRTGAYCTGFAKSRTPRVYMTYTGTDTDIITLAHELGHAYHSWVMRELPLVQTRYGMSLAETASTFGETSVRETLLAKSDSSAARFTILWEEMAALTTFLLNIPVRYAFEKRVYEAREERPLRVDELKLLMSEAWQEWYGETMAEPDPWFWASKLHFYISGVAFYNFPYLFGYLFSTGVYQRRERFGADFHQRYVELLCDTGRMTAEDIAAKHLEMDLTSVECWRGIIDGLAPRVAAFEQTVAAI